MNDYQIIQAFVEYNGSFMEVNDFLELHPDFEGNNMLHLISIFALILHRHLTADDIVTRSTYEGSNVSSRFLGILGAKLWFDGTNVIVQPRLKRLDWKEIIDVSLLSTYSHIKDYARVAFTGDMSYVDSGIHQMNVADMWVQDFETFTKFEGLTYPTFVAEVVKQTYLLFRNNTVPDNMIMMHVKAILLDDEDHSDFFLVLLPP